ncbi:MAG: hypothetical protein HYV04_00140 [Deltaproteobacteria bacterium]|nr:hypothetical protein [Deltaproteobacteria bacterium]
MTTPIEPLAGSLEEKLRTLEHMQRATLNILEDFDSEKQRLEQVQRASLNILEDFDAEKTKLEGVQRAAINILEDFDEEKRMLQGVQRATLNILEDFNAEKTLLEDSQRALLNILEDIDVEKAKVATANQQLEAANKELEAFTYSVSHDLRAPVRHMHGYADLLKKSALSALDDKGRHYLDTILDSAKQMADLIDELLAFSRLGQAQMKKIQVNLDGLVQEAVKTLRSDMEGRNIVWKIDPLPEVYADPFMLRLVLVNYVSNALKFTRTRPQAKIEVGTRDNQGSEAVVFVRDNGVGFNMRYADKLFGVFQRLHRAEEFEGTGIGLANVRRIIHRHGGRAWAEGKVDGGATFYFSLPKSRKGE